ncbi:efflux RND transporter permease subunit [Rheinheimera sp.]|uniref:efflux RND transporter permease subunit n=1 Tax=Rheinheimera sp. TaxID=1869214 RepID=UPI003AF5E9A6
MSLNLSAWSIRNPIPAILLFLLLTLAGLVGFSRMQVQNFPDVEMPTIWVTAELPGASAVQLENEVARPLENAISSIQGVWHIQSQLSDGQATLQVEFRLEKPLQEALDQVRDAVARQRTDLPAELLDPVVRKEQFSGSAILTYAVQAQHMDQEQLSWFVDQQLIRPLQALAGVGAVNRLGGSERELRVELLPEQLLAFNFSAAELSAQLKLVLQDSSGGQTDIGGAQQSVRTFATVQSAKELAQLELNLPAGQRVRLSQIATVSDTVREAQSQALLGDQQVVGFEIVRALGAGELEVASLVQARVQRLQAEHPAVQIRQVADLTQPVAENYQGSLALLYEGALLAVLVVWLFLRSGRATLVAATALPLSVIPTFALMYWLGYSLNTVTLLSLSLVVGVLVDDAIVEIENIMRHLRQGKTPYQAAMEAADEIGLAVVATTFALVAVFLPTAFMGGVVGRFFVQFGWTAAFAVLFSLLVARLLTPMLAAYWLQPPRDLERQAGWQRRYQQWLLRCLHHRARTLLAAAACFVSSLALLPWLPTGFMPADDLPQIQVSVTLPPGSSLEQTLQVSAQLRELAMQNPEVQQVFTLAGTSVGMDEDSGIAGPLQLNKASLSLQLLPSQQRSVSRLQLESQLRTLFAAVPGVRVRVGDGESDTYQLVLQGEDSQLLSHFANQLAQQLRTLDGIGAVTSSASLTRPELVVRPDFSRAASAGVVPADIAASLRVATSGDYGQELARIYLNERKVPVRVRLSAADRADLGLLKRLPVPGLHGAVPLETVASLELGSGPADLTRYDRQRNISLDIELNGQSLGQVEQAILALPLLQQLPAGIQLAAEGDAEQMAELFSSFGLAMATGVLCIYIVLVLLFKDFVQPVTILAALVLSVPGAVAALFVTQSALSMPSMIGLIMLIGIASKNSILLVDYIILARRNLQLSRLDALVDACQKRGRPIVMTSLAMGAGMLPIALGLGADASFRAPMAIVVIGGLFTSTVLSLLVVPVVFTYVDDLVLWLRTCFKTPGSPL